MGKCKGQAKREGRQGGLPDRRMQATRLQLLRSLNGWASKGGGGQRWQESKGGFWNRRMQVKTLQLLKLLGECASGG